MVSVFHLAPLLWSPVFGQAWLAQTVVKLLPQKVMKKNECILNETENWKFLNYIWLLWKRNFKYFMNKLVTEVFSSQN